MEVPALAATELEVAVEALRRANPQAASRSAGAALDVTQIGLECPNRAAELRAKLLEAERLLPDQKRDFLAPGEILHRERGCSIPGTALT
jgi:hypothetical protein